MIFKPTVNDPPPVYTEKPHKSPEHLLVPRLSSVEEFHEPSLSPPANSDEMTTHDLDHTPTTMVTNEEETVTNSEATSQPVSFTVTTSEETSEHVTMTNSSKVDVAMTTSEPHSEETNEHVTMTSSGETSGHVTMTNSSEATNAPIEITVTSSLDNVVAMTTSSEADITMATNQPQENKDTDTAEATPTSNGDVEVVDPSEINIQVTINDSV